MENRRPVVKLKEPSALKGIAIISILFVGSGAVGTQIARMFAPGSFVAQFVGLFMLPLSFLVGLQFWLGLAIFLAIAHLLGKIFRKRTIEKDGPTETVVPSGSFVFVPVGVFFGAVSGAVTGLLPSSIGFFQTFFAYFIIGLLYGIVTWMVARSGNLSLPHE